MWTQLPALIFDGLAYGSLLFLMGVGLSITLGLMNVVNLAHGVFALFGGYLFIALLQGLGLGFVSALGWVFVLFLLVGGLTEDRKSTRLNSSHVAISYAVFCLKKKKFQESGMNDVYKQSTRYEL